MRQQDGHAAEQQHQDIQGLNPMRDTDEQAMTLRGRLGSCGNGSSGSAVSATAIQQAPTKCRG
jgi:hypothetical protein